jgi:hypothetical protein
MTHSKPIVGASVAAGILRWLAVCAVMLIVVEMTMLPRATASITTAAPITIASLTLYDADANQPITGYEALKDGMTLDVSKLPTRNLSIRANTTPTKVGSVQFALDGQPIKTENFNPYTIAGDRNGKDYFTWKLPAPGQHTLTVTPYDKAQGQGAAGAAMTIRFTLVNGAKPTATPASPTATPTSAPATPTATAAPSPTVAVTPTAPAAANAYYIAQSGADTNPGTLDKPLRTIQKCAEIAKAGQTCFIRAGVYRETVRPANSGTAAAPITFVPYNNEQVTISGADPVSGWSLYKGNIYQVSVKLPVDGYADTGFFANQVFVDNAMQTEARWPNTGPDLMKPKLAGCCVQTTEGNAAYVENKDIPDIGESWVGATVWTNEWYTSRTGTITSVSGKRLNAEMTGPWRHGYWFYLTGKLGLLDSAGEWFYDGKAQKLYFWAPNGSAPTNVEAKRRNFAFDLSDRSHVTVKGLNVFAATITTSDVSESILVDGITAKYVSHHVTLPPLPKSEQAPGTDNALLLASHAHDTGIMLRGKNHTLKNSAVMYSSGNGVLLEGSGHTVENNVIRDANYVSSYAGLVRMNGEGHKIIRNTLSGAGRDAIVFDWHTGGFSFKNTEIAYNDISRFGALSSDLGGIYLCCFVDLTGTRIHHNSAHDPYGYSFHWEVAGIYTDNWSYNVTVDHNVIWNINVNKPASLKIASKLDGKSVERVYNNTVLGRSYLPPNAKIRNNLLLENDNVSGPKASHNLFKGANPRFTKPESGDFTLQSGSPAIDAGVAVPGLTDGFKGKAPDIGAYEQGAPAWKAGASLPTP